MHLAGVQSRGRYLVFALPLGMILFGGVFKVSQWTTASQQIQRKAVTREYLHRQKIITWVLACLVLAGFLLLQTILPMVLYDNKWALNWLWVSVIAYTGAIGFFISLFLIIFGTHLFRECQQAMDNGNHALKPVIDKVKKRASQSSLFCT